MPTSSDLSRKFVFISHRHVDEAAASSLCDLLLSALDLDEEEIRCTSVPGHQLPFGVNIAEHLKKDLNASTAVIALFTPDSINASWIIFEMGACWALGKTFIPILAPGVLPSDLPGPLAQYPAITVDATQAPALLHGAIGQIAAALDIQQKPGPKSESKLMGFLAAFRLVHSNAVIPRMDEAKAFLISWIAVQLATRPKHAEALYEEIRCYLDDLGIILPTNLRSYFQANDQGASTMKFLEISGGQLAARKPELLRFFEAGANLRLDIGREGGSGVDEIVRNLGIPTLQAPPDRLVERTNEIQEYFKNRLKSSKAHA